MPDCLPRTTRWLPKLSAARRSWLVLLFVLWGVTSGCSSFNLGSPLSVLDPQERREQQIARQVKNDPFPSASQIR